MPDDRSELLADEGATFRNQAAFAHPRFPYQGDELNRGLLQRPRARLFEHGELVLAPDERRRVTLLQLDAKRAARTLRDPDRKRLRLALDRDRLEFLVKDHLPRCPERLPAHDERPDGSRLLQPRGGVDDVSRHEALAFRRPRAERHDRLACVDRRPHRELKPRLSLVQFGDRLEDT